jgi:hypothetical protein
LKALTASLTLGVSAWQADAQHGLARPRIDRDLAVMLDDDAA